MHELSIISGVVDSVAETMVAYPGATVKEVRLRIGALASVVEDSLQFCYGLAIEGTPLAPESPLTGTGRSAEFIVPLPSWPD